MKSKILYLTNIPSPYAVDLFNGIGEMFDLTVIYERENASNRDIRWVNKDKRNYKEIFLNGISVGVEASLSISILKYIKQNIYDLIIISNYSSPTAIIAIEYFRIRKVPFYIHADGGIIAEDSKLKYKIKKHLLGSAEGYFSSGEKTNEYFRLYGKDNARIYYYPFTSVRDEDILKNTITQEQKKIIRKELGLKKDTIDKKLIISVGSVIYRKGYDILIDAAKELDDDIQIIIIGGQPNKEIQEQINKNGEKKIQFINFVNHDKISSYLQASDLFVFPTRYDVWGLVVNEAMAAGLPVITTNMCVSGLELIEDGRNGYIVEANNSNKLAQAIRRFFELDNEKREDFSKKALDKIKSYSLENMIKVYCENIDMILNYKK